MRLAAGLRLDDAGQVAELEFNVRLGEAQEFALGEDRQARPVFVFGHANLHFVALERDDFPARPEPAAVAEASLLDDARLLGREADCEGVSGSTSVTLCVLSRNDRCWDELTADFREQAEISLIRRSRKHASWTVARRAIAQVRMAHHEPGALNRAS